MAEISLSKTVNAPAGQVWASWDDFGNIYKFNPGIAASKLLSDCDAATAVGTRRECEFEDGRNWVRERVTAYHPGKLIAFEVYEGSFPIKTMQLAIELEPLGDDRTEVRMLVEFEPKGGLLGRLMVPLMKRRFRGILGALLDENAAYVENGRPLKKAA